MLVVEPAPVLRHIITHALSVQGYELATVGGLSGLGRALASFDPDIVVAELHLAEGSVQAVCELVRNRANKAVPLVLMAGAPEPELLRRARELGVDRHFCKARGLSALLDLIDELRGELAH